MADTTVFHGDHMIGFRVLTRSVSAVVTGIAAATEHIRSRMINEGVGEAAGVVAHGAVAAGVLVNRRCSGTSGAQGNMPGAAVMTRSAISRDAGVIENRWCEHGVQMAQVAILIRWQVAGLFRQIRSGREEPTDMAALTTLNDVGVQYGQKGRGTEADGGIMTGTALVLSRDVIRHLGGRDPGGVARSAVPWIDPCVAEHYPGEAVVVADVMAIRTIEGCRNVIGGLAGADETVVAGRTIAGIDAGVIEDRACEIRGVMALHTVSRRGQVIRQLTQGDDIVVAEGAVVDHTEVIIGARGEGARRVADAAVLGGGHVVIGFSTCRDAVARRAIVDNTGVVEDTRCKTVGVVAHPAIGTGGGVSGYRIGLGERADAVAIGMTGFTRLHRSFDGAVIEHPTEAEGCGGMAGGAVHVHNRMPARWASGIHAMAGVAPVPHYVRAAVVRKRSGKTRRCVALPALRVGIRMGRHRIFTDRHCAVVTAGARSENSAMIKTAVRLQREKVRRIVAIIAFHICLYVKFGFAHREHTVMTFAAASEHLLVIDRGDYRESQRRVTGLAMVGRCDVSDRLIRNVGKILVVTVHAVDRQTLVKGVRLRRQGRYDQRNSPLTGHAIRLNHQLHHIGSPGIRDKAGIRRVRVEQFGAAGIRQ